VRILNLLLLALCLLSTACAARSAVRATPPTAASVELHRMWEVAYNGGDAQALAALYAPTSYLVPPSGTLLTGGRDAVRLLFEPLLGMNHVQLIPMHQESDGVVSHSLGQWKYVRLDRPSSSSDGTFLIIARHQPDGSWLILYHTWSEHASRAAVIGGESGQSLPQ
jgi:ketosteroid isomerase-like protein